MLKLEGDFYVEQFVDLAKAKVNSAEVRFFKYPHVYCVMRPFISSQNSLLLAYTFYLMYLVF